FIGSTLNDSANYSRLERWSALQFTQRIAGPGSLAYPTTPDLEALVCVSLKRHIELCIVLSYGAVVAWAAHLTPSGQCHMPYDAIIQGGDGEQRRDEQKRAPLGGSDVSGPPVPGLALHLARPDPFPAAGMAVPGRNNLVRAIRATAAQVAPRARTRGLGRTGLRWRRRLPRRGGSSARRALSQYRLRLGR